VAAEAMLADTDTMNCPVKFIGLIAYDTPFFGVHKNVHTSGMSNDRVVESIILVHMSQLDLTSSYTLCSISYSR